MVWCHKTNCGAAALLSVAEKYDRVVQDMYEDNETVVRFVVGVKMGLYQ